MKAQQAIDESDGRGSGRLESGGPATPVDATRAAPTPRWRWPDFIQVVFDKDPAAGNILEVLMYPSVHALFLHRIGHWLMTHRMPVVPRLISFSSRLLTGGIEIHPGAVIGKRFFIDHGSGVVVGETSEIGDDVMLYHQVTIGATGWWRHDKNNRVKRHATIEDGVTIGVGASILGPVTIGARSKIGALAVVTEDVPPDSVVSGPRATYVVRAGERVDHEPIHQLGERVDPQRRET